MLKRDKISEFFRSLYHRLDEKIGQTQGNCGNCRRCCDFGVSGLSLFATNFELTYLLIHVDQVPAIVAARCPWLDDRIGCTIRELRPIGCRTYFCRPPEGYDAQSLYESALAELKCFIRKHHLPYFYAEWLKSLAPYAGKERNQWIIEQADWDAPSY